MLAEKLRSMVEAETVYQTGKARALAQLSAPFRLGGAKITSREALHDRQGFRDSTPAPGSNARPTA